MVFLIGVVDVVVVLMGMGLGSVLSEIFVGWVVDFFEGEFVGWYDEY